MRRPAINEPGHAHELTFTCFRRHPFLKAERTCQWLADAIDDARLESGFRLWAYVFMPEHVHLLIYPDRTPYDIRDILKAIKEPVGRKAVAHIIEYDPAWLPRITVRRGQRVERRFWQAGGGFDRNVNEPGILLAMVEYIHANPVRRRLAGTVEDWKWSSANWRDGKNSLMPDPIDFGGMVIVRG
jgi:putative transposase